MNRLTKYFEDKEQDASQKILTDFERYYNELIICNKKFNLTAITEREEVIIKHFADSLEGFSYAKGKILDLGSGAGFPALPFALVDREKQITLIDSVAKKVNFLNEMIKLFSLNATAEHIRAEDAARTKYRGYFDTVTARAVAPLRTLVEYVMPLLKVGGSAVVYKGDKAEEELAEAKNALFLLNGEVQEIKKYKLFDTDIKRSLIVISKRGITPAKFPRQGNKPRINPL